MLKIIIFLLIPSLSFADIKPDIKHYTHVQRAIKTIKNKDLRKNLVDFVRSSTPSRLVGTKGHAKASAYLLKTLQEYSQSKAAKVFVEGFDPDIVSAIEDYQNDFNQQIVGKYKPSSPEYKKWDGLTKNIISYLKEVQSVKGKNIVWEKKGYISPDKMIILGAHYDSIVLNDGQTKISIEGESHGADDNASGVAILLSLIKVLDKIDLPKTVRIVFFDFQELGLIGSKAYVKDHKNELTKNKGFETFINLMMLGHDSKLKDKEGKIGNFRMYINQEGSSTFFKDKKFASLFYKNGEKISNGVEFKVIANGLNQSDSYSFWSEGISSIVLSQNWEDDFNVTRNHTSNDFIETLNFQTLYNSYQYIGGATLMWAFDIR